MYGIGFIELLIIGAIGFSLIGVPIIVITVVLLSAKRSTPPPRSADRKPPQYQ